MDEFRKEIRVIEQVLSENPDFEKLMQHPGIPVEEKEKYLPMSGKDVSAGKCWD